MGKSSKPGRSRVIREGSKALGVVFILVVLMLWLSGGFISKVEPGPPAERPERPSVSTIKVERRVYPVLIEQVGNLRAMVEAHVSSRIMSQVREILAREGDAVEGAGERGEEGTLMARLDDRDIQARVREAQSEVTAMEKALGAAKAKLGAARSQVAAAHADAQKASTDYKRYQDLYQHQAATGQQLGHARAQKEMTQARLTAAKDDVQAAKSDIKGIEARIEQARAAEAAAKVMLSYTEIRAPFDGRVVRKTVDVGDMASPGQPLFFLEIPARPELHAFVSDSLIPRLRIGQALDVHIDALNRSFKGKLREIVPQSDTATRTVLAKVSLPSDLDLVNGLFGRLMVPAGDYKALVVPRKAVREVGQLYLVDVLNKEGYPMRRFVTLGKHHDDVVEILSGLNEGEEVVVP
jgi:multidrug efflux pump subunit AcrA (membrane-fusion protein)